MLPYNACISLCALIFVLFGPIFAFGQENPAPPVVESVRAQDIRFRGQGMAPFCFAFAEEQLLKDATCTDASCLKLNAAQWKYSIFDIVRAHREIELRDRLPITAETIPALFDGARETLPHLEHFKSFTAAECTLEHDLFLLNRLAESDGHGIEFTDMFDQIFNSYKSINSILIPGASGQTLASFHLDKTLAILAGLAGQSSSGADLLSRAITYRVCDRQVPLPTHHLQQRTLSDRSLLAKTIDQALAQKHSVLIDVCAYALGEFKTDECGGHAVTIKDLKDGQYLVVDSAFFSERPRQSDGSIYIPKNVVLNAIRLPNPEFQNHDSGEPPQLILDLILSEGFEVAANYILDSWLHSGRSRLATLQAFRSLVLDSTLSASQMPAVERKSFRERFATIQFQTPAQAENARQLLYEFLGKVHDDGGAQMAMAKNLAQGPWLKSLVNHADLSRPTPNIAWFD